MPRALSRLLALFVLATLVVPTAYAGEEMEAARKAADAALAQVQAAAEGDDPAAAIPLLDALREAVKAHPDDAHIAGLRARGVRGVYELLVREGQDAVTRALRKEVKDLAMAAGVAVSVREEYVTLLIGDYAEAVVEQSPPKANAALTELGALAEAQPTSTPIRAGIVRAYAYAHRRLGEEEKYAQAKPYVARVAELALAPEAPEAFRDRYASVLNYAYAWAKRAENEGAQREALTTLRALATRKTATPMQRDHLAWVLVSRYNATWEQDQRDKAIGQLEPLRELADRADATNGTIDSYLDAIDTWHARDAHAENTAGREAAYRAMRDASRRLQREGLDATSLIVTTGREQAERYREKRFEEARALLAELRPLCARPGPPPRAPHPDLSWALAWAHHHLGNHRRFDEADALLKELATLADHPQAEARHRDQLAWAVADAMWDVHEGERKRDWEADLRRLRELIALPDVTAWRHGPLIRGLHAAQNIAIAAGDVEAARAYMTEAEPVARRDDADIHQLKRMVQLYADALALELRVGGEAEVARIEARMTAIADGPQGTQAMRSTLRGAWVDTHIEAEKAADATRIARTMRGLRDWLAAEGATRTVEDRGALAVMLYNRHWYALGRKEMAVADAALAELRQVATAPDATPPMRFELVAALRARHYPLATVGGAEADALLDEMRALVKAGGAGPKGYYSFARALSWSHAKRGDARQFARADRELAEMRALAKEAALTTVDERLCQTLADAVWDHVNGGRPLDLKAALAEMETLAFGDRAGPIHRRRLVQALADVHDGMLKGRVEGDAAELLRRIAKLATRPDADVPTGNSLAYARSQHYEHALEIKQYTYAAVLLEALRTAADASDANAYEGRRYAYALVDGIWDEGDREQWPAMRTHLARLRALAKRWPDEKMRPLLAWGIRCGHAHTRWAGMAVESDMLVEELRQLVTRHPKEPGARTELANALSEHVAYALDEPSDRDAADRPLAELSDLALTPSENEGPRNYLAFALKRLYEWAKRTEVADQRDNAVRQLRIIARREAATTRQREHFATVLQSESFRARVARQPDDVAVILADVERLHAAEPRSKEIRNALVSVLEHTAETEFREDKRALGEQRVERLRALATGDAGTVESRAAYARALYASLNCAARIEGTAAGEAVLETLRARWKADGAESVASIHYGLGMISLLEDYRDADDADGAKRTETRLRALLAAEPGNLALQVLVAGALEDD